MSKKITIKIDNEELELEDPSKVNFSISYKIEDPDNFQVKTSAEAFNVEVPATKKNERISNSFQNATVEDLTNGQGFRNLRPALIQASGCNLLVGQAQLVSAKHTNIPTSYSYDIYGNNADWIINLKDCTLYDFLKWIRFSYSRTVISNSWNFNGMDRNLPYVFAPVRYMLPFDNVQFDANDTADQRIAHYMTDPSYLCPSLSIYWILFEAFKSIGYKIQSDFFDTSYARKMVMPWTFGAFPSSNGTKQDVHKFVAASYNPKDTTNNNFFNFDGGHDEYVDLNPIISSSVAGTYDNEFLAHGTYSFSYANKEAKWTYLQSDDFGVQDVCLSMQLNYHAWCNDGNDLSIDVDWWHIDGITGVRTQLDRTHVDGQDSGGILGGMQDITGPKRVYCYATVKPKDAIVASVHITMRDISKSGGVVRIHDFNINEFRFEYFRTPLDQGGFIDFNDYTFLKQYKFTDFFKGVIDLVNLSVSTDPVNKIIFLEPTHPYSLTNDNSKKQGGYINGFLDWSDKQDLEKESEMTLYKDLNREMIFRFKEDGADGCLKVVGDRVQSSYQYAQDLVSTSDNQWGISKSLLGSCKYVLTDRFPKGVKEVQNSFFSPCMHYIETNWQGITGVAPQLICIIPENISNTSASESGNTFNPKIAWYKGNISGVGGWKYDGQEYSTMPYMFGVNYKPGGENDPVLSYSDELINGVVGTGLFRRFFLQRMAIIRNGQWYKTYFRVNDYDISNLSHREHIILQNQKWELEELKNYKPATEESTETSLRKWSPITIDDMNSIFPTYNSVKGSPDTTNFFETKYQPLMCLASDIPQQH